MTFICVISCHDSTSRYYIFTNSIWAYSHIFVYIATYMLFISSLDWNIELQNALLVHSFEGYIDAPHARLQSSRPMPHCRGWWVRGVEPCDVGNNWHTMKEMPWRCQYSNMMYQWITITVAIMSKYAGNYLKNIVRHTAHTIVSWPNPKQWLTINE